MIYNVPGMPSRSLDIIAESSLHFRDLIKAFINTGEMNRWEDACSYLEIVIEHMTEAKLALEETKNA